MTAPQRKDAPLPTGRGSGPGRPGLQPAGVPDRLGMARGPPRAEERRAPRRKQGRPVEVEGHRPIAGIGGVPAVDLGRRAQGVLPLRFGAHPGGEPAGAVRRTDPAGGAVLRQGASSVSGALEQPISCTPHRRGGPGRRCRTHAAPSPAGRRLRRAAESAAGRDPAGAPTPAPAGPGDVPPHVHPMGRREGRRHRARRPRGAGARAGRGDPGRRHLGPDVGLRPLPVPDPALAGHGAGAAWAGPRPSSRRGAGPRPPCRRRRSRPPSGRGGQRE